MKIISNIACLALVTLLILSCKKETTYNEVSINLTSPGTLNTIASTYLKSVTILTLTGTIDARDFKTMRDSMPLLSVIDLSKVTIAAYTGSYGTMDSINCTYVANSIPQWAFCYQESNNNGIGKKTLTSIIMPSSLTNIESFAFFNCSGLIGPFTLPSSVKYIGDYAFSNCGFQGTLTISSSVTYIGAGAFSNCVLLETLIIPSSVTYIGAGAFSFCTLLPSLTIPSSVTYIGIGVSEGCSNFSEFIVDEGNTSYSSLNGVLLNKNQSTLIEFPGGMTGTYIIPSTVDSIENNAFAFSTLSKITIPLSVTYIGDYAYSSITNLTTIIDLNPVPLTGNAMGNYLFLGDNATLYVPSGSISSYQAIPQWNSFNIVAIPN